MCDMPCQVSQITPLILEQLANGERRVLSLIVSVTKAMNRAGSVKGDPSCE